MEVDINDNESDTGSDSSLDESTTAADFKIISELREKIAQNELDYEAHVALISCLQKLGELEETRKARENMNNIYPLSPDLWMEWLSNEQKICTSKEERNYIIDLFEKAVKEYMSVKIWVEYIMFTLGGGDSEKTKDVCERALMAVGIHLAEGELIWQSTYLVEQQFYAALVAGGDEKLIEDQKKRLQNLFRRQSRVALMNINKQEFLDEAARWFDDGHVDPNIKIECNKSFKRMQEKMPYEIALSVASDDTAKLEAYRKYLDLVRANDNPAVIQNVYERTVTDLCLNAGIWEEYVRFVMDQFSFADYVVLPVCERSQLNCPWSGTLCQLHITSLQRFQDILGEQETQNKIKMALERTLRSGVIVGSELVRCWMAYLVYLRMKIRWQEEHQEQLKTFRDSCETAKNFIDQKCGEEGDLDCEISRFQARVEAESAKNIECARALWNDYVMKRNQNFKNAHFWIEFIELERSYGTIKHARKLFRRALERVWDLVEVIGQAYLRFEQQIGDQESMTDFEQRYRDRLSIVQKKRLQDATKEQKEKDRNKNKIPSQGLSVENTFVKPSVPSTSQVSEPVKRKVAPPPGYNKRKVQEEASASPSKRQKGATPDIHGEFVKHDSSLDICTVFLSNIDYETQNNEILPIFSECGPIEALRITRDFKGRSKGFGYLVFTHAQSVPKAIALDRTPIKERPMYVSLCNPGERDNAFKFSTAIEKDKLFVRGLPFSMKAEDVRKEFALHGDIKDLRLVTHRNGHSKGTCYIDYHDSQTAANVLRAMNGAVLLDKTISVFISNPSKTKSNPIQPPSLGLGDSRPGTSRGATQRPKVSFIPRALLKKTEEEANGALNGGGTPDKPKSNQDFRNMLLNK